MSSNSLRRKLLRWQRTFHTIRHLKPRQAWYFFLRRGIGARRVKPHVGDVASRSIIIHPVLQLTHADGNAANYVFNFLNYTLAFSPDAMNWSPQDAQRLWRYNLHYFDFLRDAARPLQQKTALIDDWIAHNLQGSEPAWEPYTASLRIVNWCVFFWSLPAAEVRETWRRSMYDQARWLACNLELHILANHYFENIKALLFAAIFFDNRESARWLERFQRELIEQLREQILDDGGHYERCPQYHCILLEDFFDLYALFSANPMLETVKAVARLKESIEKALGFLALIATPDDDIPLFNDSASGIASRPSTIFAKAHALGFDPKIESIALIDLPASGLFGWKSGGDYFLIDCGDVGPAYQPGHTHCDCLSYVLMVENQWLIVDSGLCEYEPGSMRQYVRSTKAHNTVSIDGAQQSEVWGEFRVGRRARSLGASINSAGNFVTFIGAYCGFPTLSADIMHRRKVLLTLDQVGNIESIAIEDDITGNSDKTHCVETLLHLHPSLKIVVNNDTMSNDASVTVLKDNQQVATISSISTMKINSDDSWYCPQFGLKYKNENMQVIVDTPLPTNLSYRIECRPKELIYEDGALPASF